MGGTNSGRKETCKVPEEGTCPRPRTILITRVSARGKIGSKRDEIFESWGGRKKYWGSLGKHATVFREDETNSEVSGRTVGVVQGKGVKPRRRKYFGKKKNLGCAKFPQTQTPPPPNKWSIGISLLRGRGLFKKMGY